jgi:hypothetical protein
MEKGVNRYDYPMRMTALKAPIVASPVALPLNHVVVMD